MNEPKRRGRPPKAKVEETAREVVAEGRYVQVVREAEPSPAEQIGAMQAEVVNVWAQRQAQAYARRIWSGQSPDVPRAERLKRIAAALEAQGLSMEGVEL